MDFFVKNGNFLSKLQKMVIFFKITKNGPFSVKITENGHFFQNYKKWAILCIFEEK